MDQLVNRFSKVKVVINDEDKSFCLIKSIGPEIK